MNTNFDKLLTGFFSYSVSEAAEEKKAICEDTKKVSEDFKDVLDRMATELVLNTFDNRRLVEAMIALPKVGRIVLVFYIILDMKTSEIAYLLDSSVESIYVQKSKAIRKLREYMNDDQQP